MTVQITIRVPDRLERQVEQYQDRLPEALERGLWELAAEDAGQFQEANEVIETLASQPAPEEILALRPSPALQARVSELLAQSKAGLLSLPDEAELGRLLTLEHLVRLAKAHAYQQLG